MIVSRRCSRTLTVRARTRSSSRLRRRLGEAASRLNLNGVRVGHAAFSPECRTAEALLSQAARDAQTGFFVIDRECGIAMKETA